MKIAYYSYDHVLNPWCGGGGAYRDLAIHNLLAQRHDIHCYYGKYKGAAPVAENRFTISFLGITASYLLSRITYSLFATLHCLFVKADIIVVCYSIFSPVLSFPMRRKKTVLELFHLARNEPLRKYSFFGIAPLLFEHYALRFGKNIICINRGMAAYIAEKYPNKNVEVIYTGFDDRLVSASTDDDNTILCMGRIDIHMKGIDVLIDSFETIAPQFAGHRLVIAGRGSAHDTAWLRKRIENSPVGARIIFRENVSRKKNGTSSGMRPLSACLRASRVGALPQSKRRQVRRRPSARGSWVSKNRSVMTKPGYLSLRKASCSLPRRWRSSFMTRLCGTVWALPVSPGRSGLPGRHWRRSMKHITANVLKQANPLDRRGTADHEPL